LTAPGFVEGLVGFGCYLSVALIALRVFSRKPRSGVVVLTALLAYAGLVGWAAVQHVSISFWSVSAMYWCPTLGFLMVFGAVYKSISLRILLDLASRPDRAESYQAILKRYVQQESYLARLAILSAAGLADRLPEGLQLTPKGLRIAAICRTLQSAFRIEQSG